MQARHLHKTHIVYVHMHAYVGGLRADLDDASQCSHLCILSLTNSQGVGAGTCLSVLSCPCHSAGRSFIDVYGRYCTGLFSAKG